MADLDRANVVAVKRSLTDVRAVLEALGILGQGKERQRQAAGFVIRCPVHEDRTPSCSVQLRDGEILWRCHGCQASGDVLTLVAAVRGLSVRRDFKAVLLEGARMGGLWHVVDELEGRQAASSPSARPAPRVTQESPARAYPPLPDVEALWRDCEPLEGHGEVSAYLFGRAINPELVDGKELARVLPARGALPTWALCRNGNWREAGYRLIVPMRDSSGALRSVRAWRVVDGDGPKRLPPAGHKAAELVMADDIGIAMLIGTRKPQRIVLVEGESDYLTWGTRMNDPTTAVMGIVSGSWTQALANRFPIAARVDVQTDHDQAGDRYFTEIESSLRRRCLVFRSREAA